MRDDEGIQKREFVRIEMQLPVRYKFLSSVENRQDQTVYKGNTSNISAGGILLHGPLPSPEWVVDLLMLRVALGINLFLPDSKEPVKALARATWVESLDDQGMCSMGLRFKEITRSHKDFLVQLIIQSEMP